MFDAASSPGQNRRPLPPAQSPAGAVPGPRTPSSARKGPAKADRSGEQRDGRQRDAFFDNAKYLAIVLVAVGHSWEPLKSDSRVLQGVYDVVYTFHMPAFVLISGYFSRNFDLSPVRLKRLITGVAVPYVVFETAYSLFERYFNHNPGQDISLVYPFYLTWFLCALFVWRLTTPIWKLVRWPVPLALVVAMLATVASHIGDVLNMQRLLQFLPYFVLGVSLKPEHFRLVRRRSVRILSVPVFATALLVGWWAAPRMNAAWFYRRDSAPGLGAPWWTGPVMTLVMFGCAVLLTACFLSWVPGRNTWFTAIGSGTLYGYLLHGFLRKAGEYNGWFDHAWLHTPLGEIFVTVLAATVVTVLCTKPVQRVFRFAMEPKMEWAFRQDPVELARERQRRDHERAKVSL
ncbi:acyltransferase family protein [Streptomyces sp. JA03]|nr:acyltransferase family protein [Streptomyces barringtoniae]MCC5480257.1 acyltransferase family protein [Streptomyces barringtoniae]